MKFRPSIILSSLLFCIVVYGLFAFGVHLLRLDGNNGNIKISGRIEGIEYHAAAKVAGKVITYNVEEGQEVQTGEQIAIIDSPQLNALIDEAKAHVRKAALDLKHAETEYARYSRMLTENIISKQIYDEERNKYLTAKEDYNAAENELNKLMADLGDTKIVAPISGVIVTKIVQAGEVVGVGVPLVSIVNMDDLFLKAFLPTESVGKVRLGCTAKIFPDAFPNEVFDAYVSKVASKAEFTPKNVETKSQRANMVFEIKLKVKENRDYKLKPGMPAEAIIHEQRARP